MFDDLILVEGSMKVHDLIEKMIEHSTKITGSRLLRTVSICRDDHGMGRIEEREIRRKEEKKESDRKIEKRKNVEKKTEVTDQEYFQAPCHRSKEVEETTNAEFSNDHGSQNKTINLLENIVDDESIHACYKDSRNPKWTRCLITIEKTESIANKSNDYIANGDTKLKDEDKKKLLFCLPNIFDDKNFKSSTTSNKLDDFIFPGFRKDLFRATWKGGEKQILDSVLYLICISESNRFFCFTCVYLLTCEYFPRSIAYNSTISFSFL